MCRWCAGSIQATDEPVLVLLGQSSPVVEMRLMQYPGWNHHEPFFWILAVPRDRSGPGATVRVAQMLRSHLESSEVFVVTPLVISQLAARVAREVLLWVETGSCRLPETGWAPAARLLRTQR